MNKTLNVVKAHDQVIGVNVKNNSNEHLGKVKEIMLDKLSGQVAYVVLDCGGFLGLGGKLYALPWHALHYDDDQDCFKVDVNKERLSNAPGFDKDNWPDMSDKTWGENLANYYGTKPYWHNNNNNP